MDLATLFTLHAAPALLAIGFSIMLVVSLVVAEEAEVRRNAADEGPSAPRSRELARRL